MAWKYLNIKKANARLDELHNQLRSVGHPEETKPHGGSWRYLNIGKANAEIDRLTTLLSSFTPPVITNPISGQQPAVSKTPTIITPTPVAPRVAGLPGLLSRHQLLSALELFPAVDVVGDEDNATLAVMLKNASADAGIRLPGEPAEPTPGELRQAAVNKILAETPAAAAGTWNASSLAALVDSRRGKGTARNVTQEATPYDCSATGLAAQMNQHMPGSYQWTKLAQQMKGEGRKRLAASCSPAEEQRKFEVLRGYCASQGWRIPGLSYAGLEVKLDPAAAARPAQRAADEKAIAEFAAVLGGDEQAALVQTPSADAARQYVAATNCKPYKVGMLPGRHDPAPVRTKGIYGGIPPAGI